ncbi:MAG: STAS domain-containing protein [Clostridiales bacterium]|jgi:anti-anti-sigma factor|nr:STAS domain-containing protein [Clostridiales bacterium]
MKNKEGMIIMTITKTQGDGTLILALQGRLDTATAPQLQEELIPALADAKNVVLDFANLAYISSAGLRVLLMGEKQAKLGPASMTLRNVPEEVLEVLSMTGFTDILNIEG